MSDAFKSIFFSAAIGCLFFACSKEDVVGSAGPQGPDGINGNSSIPGTFFGKVVLYDSLGKPAGDNGDVTVSVNADPVIQFVSGQDGYFSSPSFSSGVYNLSFSKEGYGTMNVFNFQHTGGPNPSQTGLIEMGKKLSSWFDIKRMQMDAVNSNSYNATFILSHPQNLPYAWVVFYFSHSPGVGPSSNDFAFRTVGYQLDDSTISVEYDLDFTMYTDKLNQSTIYVSMAVDNSRSLFYIDTLGNTVFPAAGNLSPETTLFNIFKQ